MKTLGIILARGRIDKGLTIEEASEKIHISRTTLSRLEKDLTQNIIIDNFINIANFLEIDFFEMLNACKMKLFKIELNTALKFCRVVYYKGKKIDKEKLEELINQNLKNIIE